MEGERACPTREKTDLERVAELQGKNGVARSGLRLYYGIATLRYITHRRPL